MRQTAVLTGHNAAIYALAAYKGAGQFLSAAGEGWVVRWDLQQGQDGHLLTQVEGSIFGLLYLPDTQQIAVGTMQGGLYWLDLETNTPLVQTLAHAGGVFALAADTAHLYTAGGDGRLVRWGRGSRKKEETLELSPKAIRRLALSPEGTTLWAAGSEGIIYTIDLPNFSLRSQTPAHSNSVFSLLYLPQYERLVSGGRDAYMRLWSAKSGEDLRLLNADTLPAHLFTVNDLVLSPCGNFIASASRDKTVKIWRSSDLQLLRVMDTIRYSLHRHSVNCLLWQENQLITGSDDRSLMIYAEK